MSERPDTGNPSATQEIISRVEAKARGLQFYFTGKPCKRGHVEPRPTKFGYCPTCHQAACKRNYEANKARHLENGRRWREANPERDRDHATNWRAKNKAKRVEICRRYYENHREAQLKRNKDWRDANPVKQREYRSKRRARERNAPGHHTADEIQTLYQRQRGRCVYCHASLKAGYHADHIVPLILGGSNWIANIQLLCPTCNKSKGGKDPIQFAQDTGRLL